MQTTTQIIQFNGQNFKLFDLGNQGFIRTYRIEHGFAHIEFQIINLVDYDLKLQKSLEELYDVIYG